MNPPTKSHRLLFTYSSQFRNWAVYVITNNVYRQLCRNYSRKLMYKEYMRYYQTPDLINFVDTSLVEKWTTLHPESWSYTIDRERLITTSYDVPPP